MADAAVPKSDDRTYLVWPGDPPLIEEHHINEALRHAVSFNVADVHVTPGYPLRAKIGGVIRDMMTRPLNPDDAWQILHHTRGIEGVSRVKGGDAVSYSHEIAEKDGQALYQGAYRFRVEASPVDYWGESAPKIVFRYLPSRVPSLDKQNPGLPEDLVRAMMAHSGMILIVGGTGTGKSTLLAGVIKHLGQKRPAIIQTFEEPIEFTYRPSILKEEGVWRATLSQSEIGRHFRDSEKYSAWAQALRSALRSGPDILLIGEMRDAESIAAAVDFVRTDHLLFSTMHVNGVAAIPSEIMARTQGDPAMLPRVISVLSVAVFQRLVPRADGQGRVAAREYLIITPELRKSLLLKNAAEIEAEIREAMEENGTTLKAALIRLVQDGTITEEAAFEALGDTEARFDFSVPLRDGPPQPAPVHAPENPFKAALVRLVQQGFLTEEVARGALEDAEARSDFHLPPPQEPAYAQGESIS